jgi:hypothetical protein
VAASARTFRRTYPSWSHDRGVRDKVVAQLMGHTNVDTTLNVYTQVLDGSLRKGTIFAIVYRRIVPRLGHAQAVAQSPTGLCLIWKILHQGIRYEERGPAVSAEAKKVRPVCAGFS